MTREEVLCGIRLCCKAIEILCFAAGKEEQKEEENAILQLLITFLPVFNL